MKKTFVLCFVLFLGCQTDFQSPQGQPEDLYPDVIREHDRPLVVAPRLKSGEVITSNFELDLSRLEDGEDFWDYVDGKNQLDISMLLKHTDASFQINIDASMSLPQLSQYSDQIYSVAGFLTFPAQDDPQLEDYAFPVTAPHLENMLDSLHDPSSFFPGERLPLIIFSHGHGASPIWHLGMIGNLASQGYAVLSLFHGDHRFGDDYIGFRVLAYKEAIETLQEHSRWSSLIDFEKIGILGLSGGGTAATIAMGGKVQTQFGRELQFPIPEIKVAVGLLPWLGDDWVGNILGPNQIGASSIDGPMMFILGGLDTVAVPQYSLHAMAFMTGPRYFVTIPEIGHNYSDNLMISLATLHFDTYLKVDDQAREVLENIGHIENSKAFQIYDFVN